MQQRKVHSMFVRDRRAANSHAAQLEAAEAQALEHRQRMAPQVHSTKAERKQEHLARMKVLKQGSLARKREEGMDRRRRYAAFRNKCARKRGARKRQRKGKA